jgi:glycosyltransferase involved in cell wall biosynthesis
VNRLSINPEHQNPWEKATFTGEVSKFRIAYESGELPVSLPKISVITPCFRSGHTLERTIRSVLLQGYPNLEFILMDGGSDDESIDVIKYYQDVFNYWCSHPDEGQSDAINKGFSRATGDLLTWLNGDDIYFKDALWHIAEGYIESQRGDIILGLSWLVDVNFNFIHEQQYQEVGPEAFKDYRKNYIIQPGCFFSKQAWLKYGPVDITLHYAMDFDLFMRMSQGYPIHIIRKHIAFSVFHEDCKTMKDRVKSIFETAVLQVQFGAPEIAKRELAVIADEHKFLEQAFHAKKDRKRILFAITEFNVGGAQTFVIRLMREIVKQHDVYLFILDPSNVSEKITSQIPAEVSNISTLNIRDPSSFAQILKLLKIDLVHSNLYHVEAFLADCYSREGIQTPWVLCDHGDYKFVENAGIATGGDLARILNYPNAIIITADSERQTFERYVPGISQKIEKITLCVDKPDTVGSDIKRLAIRKNLGINQEDMVVLCSARGIEEKGWAEAILVVSEILTQLKEQNSKKSMHLLCLGDSEYLRSLRYQVEQTEARTNIHFLGFQSDVSSYLTAADVGLILTVYPAETLNLSAIEMMAFGKPVVATRWGALQETLADPISNAIGGCFINVNKDTGRADIIESIDALLNYFYSPNCITTDGRAALLAFEKFSVDKIIGQYSELILRLTC